MLYYNVDASMFEKFFVFKLRDIRHNHAIVQM